VSTCGCADETSILEQLCALDEILDHMQSGRDGVPAVRRFVDEQTPSDVLTAVRLFVVEAFDGRFSTEDWEHTAGGWRVIAFDGDDPVAHGAVVPRRLRVGQRDFDAGYVEGVATRTGRHAAGLGSAVMTEISNLVRTSFELGGLSTGRRSFYQHLGWEPWRGPSYVQHEGELLRTPDEDDGLMVLRFGPSADINLESPIVCQRRTGDDW
jgi:aminoglycoside 2'-N-acetyltransferase I